MDDSVPTQIRDTVEQYFDLISTRDQAAWSKLFDSDAVVHDPADSPPVEGELAAENIWKMLTAPFEALEIEPDDIFFCGSSVATKWSAHARGINGATTDFEGITVFELNSAAKLQTVISYWDPGAVLLSLAG